MRSSMRTSARLGTFSRVSVSLVSSAAIISGRAAFLAPEMRMTPFSACPPVMRMRSINPPFQLRARSLRGRGPSADFAARADIPRIVRRRIVRSRSVRRRVRSPAIPALRLAPAQIRAQRIGEAAPLRLFPVGQRIGVGAGPPHRNSLRFKHQLQQRRYWQKLLKTALRLKKGSACLSGPPMAIPQPFRPARRGLR